MTTSSESPAKGLNPILRILLAFLLLAPALLCCASQDIGPSVMTFVTSLQKSRGLNAEAEFIGFENYIRILGDRPFLSALGFTVQVIVVRLLAVSVIPLLIGLGLAAIGIMPRRIIRAILVIPLALFVPVAIGVTWRLLTSPFMGLDAPVFGNPDTAGLSLLLIDGLSILGIAVAIGAWLYPSASKAGRAGTIVLLVVFLLAAIASGLQTFALMFVTTGGGPAISTTTLMLLMNNLALRNLQLGAGAAVGTVILIPVLILGLIAGLVIILSRVALMPTETAPVEAAATPEPQTARQPVRLVLLILGLLPALACCTISALPLPWVVFKSLGGDSFAGLFQAADLGPVFMNSVLPAFISAFLIELPIALAAAFAIGALRPIGKYSEWLLLVFSPGLFLTVAPIMVPVFQGLMAAQRIGEFTAFFTPLALSVPLLFLLTLFFKGHTAANPEASPVQLLVRSLPLALMASAVLFFGHLNEFLWPYLLARSPENYPMTLLITQLAQSFNTPNALVAAITLFWLPVFLVFATIFGVSLVWYGDRLTLKRDITA